MKAWGSGGVGPSFLTLALNEGECSASHPGRVTRGERKPGTQWVSGWMDPRAGLNPVEKRKISFPAGNRTPAIQPIARRRID
jgi:hypothetical protein